jgi:hypothetical protein
MFRSHFRTALEGLIVEIRPRCGKCKKEFALSLKNYLPGKYLSCSACGNVIHFGEAVADKIQKLTQEFEVAIQEAIEDVEKLQ